MPPAYTKCFTEKEMNDKSAQNASQLRTNAYICSLDSHGRFAHILLAREKKVGYFLNRPRILLAREKKVGYFLNRPRTLC